MKPNVCYSSQACREGNPWPSNVQKTKKVPPGHISGIIAVSVSCDIKICSPLRVSYLWKLRGWPSGEDFFIYVSGKYLDGGVLASFHVLNSS